MTINSKSFASQDITFAIVALNEERRIAGAINSIKCISSSPIAVYDGGSTDLTAELAMSLGARVKCLPGSSIESRRRSALEECSSAYLCFLDADQIFQPLTNLGAVLMLFKKNNLLAGVQFCLKAIADEPSYWTRGFAFRHNVITGMPGSRKVIGTPSIFRVSALLSSAYMDGISGPADDTMTCYRLRDNGYELAAISETAYEYVRADRPTTFRKAFWYGLGDAEYLRQLKSIGSILNHVFHVTLREPLLRPMMALLRGPVYFPFMLLFGFGRFSGFIVGLFAPRDISSQRT